MSKLYEVTVFMGKYTKDNEEKNRYQTIGSVMETKNGLMLKLDTIPITDAGGWNGWAWLNTPKPKEHFKGLPKDEDLDAPF